MSTSKTPLPVLLPRRYATSDPSLLEAAAPMVHEHRNLIHDRSFELLGVLLGRVSPRRRERCMTSVIPRRGPSPH